MADNLFAPPSPEEHAAVKNIGANPEADLFAPPTQEEHELAKSVGPDSAEPANLLGDLDRIKGSFGNDAGKAKLLQAQGYSHIQRNKDGDLVAQGPDGKFYKDQNNFFGHPINWLESHLGGALPTAGMALGGAAGAASGVADAGTTSIPGAMAGAGAGSAAGEAGRIGIGKLLGTYQDDSGGNEPAKDVLKEAALGALAEGGGRLAAPYVEPYLKAGTQGLANLGKKAVGKVSQFMSGAPSEAVERLIERPTQVLNADKPGNALDVAGRARQEFLDRNQAESKAIQQARRTFRDKFGNEVVDTSPILENHQSFLDNVAPSQDGIGPVSPDKLQNLDSTAKNALTTTQKISNELPFSPEQLQASYRTKALRKAADLGRIGKLNDIPMNPYDLPTEETLPMKSAGDLQKYADYLDNEIKNFEQSKIPGSGDTRDQAFLRSQYGKVKDALHQLDPEGLGAADAQFSKYANDAGMLGKLENPETMEGFINNYFGKNKTLQREAASRVIPNSMDDLADIGANRAFGAQGPAGSDMGKRSIFSGTVGGLEVLHGLAEGNPLKVIAGAAMPVLTSPTVHKNVIGKSAQALEKVYGTKIFQMLSKNPQLVDTLLDKGGSSFLGGSSRPIPARVPAKNDSGSNMSDFLDQFRNRPELLDQIQDQAFKNKIKKALGTGSVIGAENGEQPIPLEQAQELHRLGN